MISNTPSTKSASYILTAYSSITNLSLSKLLNVGYESRDGEPIPSFDENLLIDLCSEAQQIFEEEKNILEIDGDFIIVGDIHGSLHDLLRILNFIQENDSKVLFLGDYVDRGNFSLECITILFAMKVMRPDSFYLIRGNHEFDAVCSLYGFKDEIISYHDPKKQKNTSNQEEYHTYDMNCHQYTEKLYDAFIHTFSFLPIAAILNLTTFCIHGGISPKLEHVEFIHSSIQRPINTFEENSDLVWSDPSHSSKQFEENLRGRGFLFNRESTTNFLNKSSLTRIIRGHQCVKKGSVKNFGDKCITIFSASSYDKEMGNSSAILQLFQEDDSIKVTTFPPLCRLQKYDTAYYKVQPLNQGEKKIKNCFSLNHPKLFSTGSFRMPLNSSSGNQLNTKRLNDFLPQQNSFRLPTIVKPKFITNSKKVLQCSNVRPRLYSSSSLNDFDDPKIKKDTTICKSDYDF